MKYFALLTKLGENLLAQATALGTKLELTHMAVGDGGGSLPTPDTNQTKLIKEQRRAAINTLFIDEQNKNQIIAEQVIPENEGGWWVREIGLFDKAGNLIAVANSPETYKPKLVEGSGRTLTVRIVLIVSHTESVILKIDPAVVLVTRNYMNTFLKNAMAGYVPISRMINNKPLNKNIQLLASDIGTYNKTEINEKIQEAYNKNTAKKYQNGWWICGDSGLIIQWAHYTHRTGTHHFQLPMKFPNAGLFCFGYAESALDYDNDEQSQSAQLIDNSTVKVTIDNGLKTAVLAIGY